MTETTGHPEPTFRFDGFYFARQSQQLVLGKNLPSTERIPSVSWDWRRVSDKTFEVRLGVTTSAVKQRPEELEVVLVGRFSHGANASEEVIQRFASLNATSILLPYAREAISSLTGRGPFGVEVMQPLNVFEFVKILDLKKATGARQLRRGKRLQRSQK